MKMMFTITAFILSTSLVFGNLHHDPEYCNNETLKLTNFLGNTLPNNFIISPTLKCISITRGKIHDADVDAFDGVPNLLYLNLENNFIKPRHLFSFGNLPKVRALILGNQVRQTHPWHNVNDDVIVHNVYPELLYLNVKNNNIVSIKASVPNPFPKLIHLDFSDNKLTWFNFQMWNNTLTHVNLNNNRILKISHKVLSNLISFTIDNNKISSIGKGYDLDLSGLSKLEYLSISSNPIHVIDGTAFVDTVNLRCLNLSDNNLATLKPEMFTSLKFLEVIMLNGNVFDTIPLKGTLNITTLLMDCNKILDLTSSSLSMLPNLRKLSLGGNMISNIDAGTFKSQELLEELYLNDNELTELPVDWDLHTKNLRYLNLSGNRFTSIAPFLSTTNIALEQIYLNDNPLKYIGGNKMTVPENITIYLNIGQKRSKPVCVPDSS